MLLKHNVYNLVKKYMLIICAKSTRSLLAKNKSNICYMLPLIYSYCTNPSDERYNTK